MLTFRKAEERDIPEIVAFTMETWDWGDLKLRPLFQQLFHRVKRRSKKEMV
jgi:hypothetical protein